MAGPAHAVSTIAADTTRAPLRDALAAGRSPTLVAGGLDRTLLRFRVAGLTARPARAVLRLRVTDPSLESVQVRTVPAFAEDAATPAILVPSLFAVARAAASAAGTWVEWDVTSAVGGNGDISLQVSGPLLDPVRFSSREGAHAPQLVVTPDDDVAVRLAALLDPATADSFDANARDDLGRSQPSIVAVPGGGFVLAVERDTPDARWVSVSNIVVRHYAGWAALAAGAFSAEANLPRTLAPTAEGTPELRVLSWGAGPASSQIEITMHYFKSVIADRQAAGVLTNFDPATWAPQVDPLVNDLFVALGTRGNLGDRAGVIYEGRRFAVLEAQSVRGDFGTWRWYLYDRDRNEARLLPAHGPAGSFALGNPSVRAFTDAQGITTLFVSGYAFGQGAAFGEAGEFIALRRLG